MSHNPIAFFQLTIDWQQPSPGEFEQGFFLRDSISPEMAFAWSHTVPMSVAPGGSIGAPVFNPEDTPSKLTFMGLEVRNLANTEYVYVEQDGEIDTIAPVLFDQGVGRQAGADLTFDPATGKITSTAGGLFLAYLVLDVAHT